MPKKPIKWGIKVWMLAEPKTGYVSNFEVYFGKSASSEHAALALGTRVVMDISKTIPIVTCTLNARLLYCHQTSVLDVSIINALILERLSPHKPSSRRRSLLQFKLDLAKQLVGGFCGRKRYPVTKENAPPWPWHYLIFQTKLFFRDIRSVSLATSSDAILPRKPRGHAVRTRMRNSGSKG